MPVGEMLSRMSSRELTEWRAFSQVEPIGDLRADIRLAILDSLIANANRDPEKRAEPFSVADFLHDYWQKPEDPQAAAVRSDQHNKELAQMLAGLGLGTFEEAA